MKTITSHDMPILKIIVILLAKSVGTQLNDAQSNGKPSPNKTNLTNKTRPSSLEMMHEASSDWHFNGTWWLTSNGLKQIKM